MPRQIRFNAFDMNCVAHQSSGLWRHPDDRSQSYTDLGYWTELAKLLEKGRFDGIFLADVLGTYDVYGGTNEAAIRNGAQIPVADPLLVIPAMAYVTEHLGFGVTAGTAYEHPYPFARRMSTLDHLTKGRVGWNVVTGYLPSAARNMGNEDQLEHDDRYDYADEYLEVLYKLWEGSWEDDAVVRDTETGVFTDPSKVHSINHSGKHFQVPGIHLSEPSPQRSPVIYQAGASSRGIAFAAGNAEAIFVAASTKAVLTGTVTKIRDALEAAGRDRYSAKIYTLLTIITDETSEKAQAKYLDYLSYASEEGALVFMSGWMGVDLSEFALDEPIGNVKSNAIQSAVANFQAANGDGSEWTVGDIARAGAIGGLGPFIVGSGVEIADQLEEWAAETDVDGFNLAYAITPGTFEDVVTWVVPELQKRGVYPTEYTEGTLRQKLHGRGDRLPDEHHGANFRVGVPVA
ncbi:MULTISPECIES: LLM class flavin-dependent oxidoreductase [unclassified Cryobacterium]|uniref:LLM class flavin-dependent oxidoreductase n=1 Tax=unclassified Cryobacterium TaxID=2649013 RepID=UPI00106C7E2C|nr:MULTISPECIES: LLM class flavin-dependent oxidoreductase [unclassified Cryobacterium]TFC53744.1 LLM class flavin-dependent oxidoreductase [Cryobacterium sp. TMB3-1-2]TFC75163.1 LLM class flavin-dependent oxidoreductase [Cryobacterium sp. TMB3-15]TFC75299.1 LLM class flavin-dependent oxidoreductase [Cryobacterium sp. TMB3-10]TFD41576.1 LLM class flavin-dependent oxidoreductase [Cryobacterium sp. TMB3-12]